MIIREETATDYASIRAVTIDAFRGMPHAGGDEQDVIERLRAADALSLSLVATDNNDVVGHIAFSPAESADGAASWFALGPVSVVPDRQRQGIGSALITRGLNALRAQHAAGCILLGDPAYYQRFGFEVSPQHAPRNEPAEYFMVCRFGNATAAGRFRFHDAFYAGAQSPETP
ncbi:MAG: N-acetyltransferase [Pseudomonadota bacterium]